MEPPEAPVLDGHLNEPAWKRPVPAGAFLQREPEEGAPATERTEVRILYDDGHLYLGISCYDREPQKIVANEMGRDISLDSDDSFSFILDTFGDRRTAYLFTINPLGARYDADRFNFGGSVRPFYSRRIGLSGDRREIPILAGGRLTGKMGRTGIGVLTVQTRTGHGEPATLFSVVRIKRDILSQSNVGFRQTGNLSADHPTERSAPILRCLPHA